MSNGKMIPASIGQAKAKDTKPAEPPEKTDGPQKNDLGCFKPGTYVTRSGATRTDN